MPRGTQQRFAVFIHNTGICGSPVKIKDNLPRIVGS